MKGVLQEGRPGLRGSDSGTCTSPFPSPVSLLHPPVYSSVSLKVILTRRYSTEKLLNIIKCLPNGAKTGVFGAVDVVT